MNNDMCWADQVPNQWRDVVKSFGGWVCLYVWIGDVLGSEAIRDQMFYSTKDMFKLLAVDLW